MWPSHRPPPRLKFALALVPALLTPTGCAAPSFTPRAQTITSEEASPPRNAEPAPRPDAPGPTPDGAPQPLSADFLSAAESASQRRDAAARANESITDLDEGRPISSGTCVGGPSKAAQKKAPSQAICCYTPPSYFITRIQKKNDDFRACYTDALKRRPDARGRVTTKFTIEEDGSVIGACDAGSTVGDPVMVACVLRVFTTVMFESTAPGSPCPPPTIMYPMRFSPDASSQ